MLHLLRLKLHETEFINATFQFYVFGFQLSHPYVTWYSKLFLLAVTRTLILMLTISLVLTLTVSHEYKLVWNDCHCYGRCLPLNKKFYHLFDTLLSRLYFRWWY